MPENPEWLETFRLIVDSELEEFHVGIPAEVQTFNRDRFTVDVQPIAVQPDGNSFPVVANIPVRFSGLYWDIQPGEAGYIEVSELDFRRWWRSGEPGSPETTGRAALASGIFAPGLAKRDEAPSLDAGSKVVSSDDLRLGAWDADEKVVIESFQDEYKLVATDHKSMLTLLNTWVGEVDVAAGPLTTTASLQTAIGNLIAALNSIIAGINAETYIADKVKAK